MKIDSNSLTYSSFQKPQTQVEEALDSWFEMEPNKEAAREVRNKILSCFENNETSLDLSHAPISSLPYILCMEEFQHLESLDLSRTGIQFLPEDFYLSSLRVLNLAKSSLRWWPSRYNLPLLKHLNLSNTPLEFSNNGLNLPSLEILDLSNTWSIASLEGVSLRNLKTLKLCSSVVCTLPKLCDIPLIEELDISNTPLEELPECFNPDKLKHFKAAHSKLKQLPKVFNPPELETMDISSTPLEGLPECFNPDKLKHLDASYSKLKRLPKIFNPPELETMDISSTPLEGLPKHFNPGQLKHLDASNSALGNFDEVFNPPKLETLDLYGTPITFLPQNFSPLSLKILKLSYSHVESLPENFNPESLEELYILNTKIVALPKNFKPPQLKKLDLTDSWFISLSEDIFQLPSTCEVVLSLKRFSYKVAEKFKERISSSDYTGPKFKYDEKEVVGEWSLESAFAYTFEKAGLSTDQNLLENLIKDHNELSQNHLREWLKKLSETASSETGRNVKFFQDVVEILKEAAENEDYRNDIFYRVLDEAYTTCGDRVALSVLHLRLRKTLKELDRSRPKQLANFLIRGVMVLDLLEDYARDVVQTLPYTDPLEVYLGLPVVLKEIFDIPIDIKNMRFFDHSGLTEDHIQAAKEKIQAVLDDEERVLNFLVQQEEWLELLSKKYPEVLRDLKAERDRRFDQEPIEYFENIQNWYHQELKKLSRSTRHTERFSLRIRS